MGHQYYVYVLARPDGTPFYIGKGHGTRVFAHEREAQSGCICEKCIVIRSIWDQGEQLQRTINFSTTDESAAFARERALIEQYRHLGLCNKTIALRNPVRIPDPVDSDDLLTVTQAAEYLGVTRQAVHLLTKQGMGKRYGSMWLFTRSELDAYRVHPRTHGGRRPQKQDKA